MRQYKMGGDSSNFKNVLVNPMDFDVGDPIILSGVILGAMLPFLFAALTMVSVGKAAAQIIIEVRRQFNEKTNAHGVTLKQCILWATEHEGEEIPPEMEVIPDSERCVAISTKSSVREMIAPGCYAILAPVLIGFLVGPRMLMGTLAGSIASGCMMGIMMSNAGGAWDNSKKLCEKLGIKGTVMGKACVVGDTVGDPFKDTSGPSLNILIKLMSMVSLTIAPLIKGWKDWENAYWGAIPAALGIVITTVLLWSKILTWKDPLSTISAEEEAKPAAKAPAEAGLTAEPPGKANGV
jgi:inorganic pyrophosphatase